MFKPQRVLDKNRITLILLVLGYGWVFLTDYVANNYAEYLLFSYANIQSLKGYIYITAASFGLYLLLSYRDKKIEANKVIAETILETTNVGIAVFDEEGKFLRINDSLAKLLNIERERATGKHFLDFTPEKSELKGINLFKKAVGSNDKVFDELVILNSNGKERNVLIDTNSLQLEKQTIVISSITDITEQKEIQSNLKRSLKEKKVLLSEVHHRVKNNLAIISSIAQLQAYNEENDKLKEELSSTVGRIQTIASVHEILYQEDNFVELSFEELFKQIVRQVVDQTLPDHSTDISFSFDLDPTTLNVNQAIPASLIIHEVISNAIKHAFVGIPKGKISVYLDSSGNSIEINIYDNGVGFKNDQLNGKTLGMQMIKLLTEQLEGEFMYKLPEKGTAFNLIFEKQKVKGIGNANL